PAGGARSGRLRVHPAGGRRADAGRLRGAPEGILDDGAAAHVRDRAYREGLGVLEELAGGLTRAFPALDGAPVLKGCAGLPTFTPDGNYLLGAVPTVRGLWVAAGCNAIGIAGSLLIGEWLSELVLEGRTRVDTSSQALDRFGPRYK